MKKNNRRIEYFRKLSDNFHKRKTENQIVCNQICKIDNALPALHGISNKTKDGKPHNVGETEILLRKNIINFEIKCE